MRALLIDPVITSALRILKKAEIELLVGLQVAVEVKGDGEAVVIFAVQDVAEPELFVAVGVVVALGAAPDVHGKVSRFHKIGVIGGIGVDLGGGDKIIEEGEKGEGCDDKHG